jgi:hypothetical protein
MPRVIRGTGLFCTNAAKSSTLQYGETTGEDAETGSKECRESFMRRDKKKRRAEFALRGQGLAQPSQCHNRLVYLAVQQPGGACKMPGAVGHIAHWFL